MRTAWVGVIGAALLVATTAARSDVVVLEDGRTLEGEIVGEDGTRVTIDTMVSERIRAQLTFARDEIDSIERKPVPPGFFDPPPPPPRVSAPPPARGEQTLYLEVPVDGAFGETVFAAGIEKAVRYARRYRIEHIVFRLNTPGGDLDEASDIWRILRRNDRQLRYHAIVQECLGDALAIAVWCDDVFMLPGGRIGGSVAAMSTDGPEAEAALRKQLAVHVSAEAERRGHAPQLVRAMFDPSETLAAWRDDEEMVVLDAVAPDDLPPGRTILRLGSDEVLVLDEDLVLALGGRRLDGPASDLGERLELPGWELESDYGRIAMEETLARKRQDALDEKARFAERVRETIERRELAERALEHNLKGAAEWDPRRGQYSTYGNRWGWTWGWSGGRRRYRSSALMTQEAQEQWRARTDTAMRYLRDAAQAVRALDQLEVTAERLGLDRTFAPDEIRMIADDIQTKFDALAANRNRQRR